MKPSEVKLGDRFGNLIVQSIQQHYRSSTGRKDGKEAICLCDCGNQRTVPLTSLVTGNTSSCGCLQKQSRSNNGYKTGSQNIKHAQAYLASHPEILQQNSRRNIKHAHSYLQSHPEIQQENGRNNNKYAQSYLASHPEIRQETGRRSIKHARAYLASHPEILQENGRRNIEFWRRNSDSESSLQKEYRLFLEQNNFPYESEFLLEEHYFDFKVNNFLIEINGDIYHSSKYENLSNPSAKPPPTTFKSPDYHKSLLDLAIKHGYRLIQLWEHKSQSFNKSLLLSQLQGEANIEDYVDCINNQKVICNDYGFSLTGEYLPDSGQWISTTSHEIVSESYEKGKVLIFNSGYTVL